MRKVRVQLLHDRLQPGPSLSEPLIFGIQDVKGSVHAGTVDGDGKQRFGVDLDIRTGGTDRPVLSGPFAHGPSAARFLYLSWKREKAATAPWGWRIKIPLASIGWAEVQEAERDGMALIADATGRRPHTSEPVIWRVEPQFA